MNATNENYLERLFWCLQRMDTVLYLPTFPQKCLSLANTVHIYTCNRPNHTCVNQFNELCDGKVVWTSFYRYNRSLACCHLFMNPKIGLSCEHLFTSRTCKRLNTDNARQHCQLQGTGPKVYCAWPGIEHNKEEHAHFQQMAPHS